MELSNIVKLECCEVDLRAKTKTESLHEIAKLLKRSRELRNISENKVFEALAKREEMGSTGFSDGIAIPHCQLPDLNKFVISIAISKKGIDFSALDNKRSKIFVTIIGPEADRNTHLQLLATVSQVLKEKNLRRELLQVKTKINLYEEFLRHTTSEDRQEISKKGKEVLMLLFVNDPDIMQDITEVFIEYGIQNSIIFDTNNMENLLSTVPLFMGFFNFTSEKEAQSKVIMLKLAKDHINAVIKGLEDSFGDLETYSGISVIVLDIFFAKGI